MEEAVEPVFAPDRKTMRRHVEHLFGGYLPGAHDGRIELAWTDPVPGPDGKYAPKHAQFFGTDQLAELVDRAAQLNATPFCNVYVGASLKHPDTPPFGRTGNGDAWALTAGYTDQDNDGDVARAVAAYGANKPTMIVVTGTVPYTRAQLWWKFDEPLFGGDWSARLKAMAAAMAGDASVSNPGRLMRLAGGVAWPTKPLRVTEVTFIQDLKEPGPSVYMPEHLALVWPPEDNQGNSKLTGVVNPPITGEAGGIFPDGRLTDGRERYMLSTVLACLIELVARSKGVPTPQQLFDLAWPQYERHVDLVSRSGRGPDEMMVKCVATIRRFQAGEIPNMKTVDDAVKVHRAKQAAWQAAPDGARKARSGAGAAPKGQAEPPPHQATAIATVDFYTLLTENVVEEPDYIEPDFAGPGNFVLIVGPPKAQKSFLLQEMLVTCATGGKFLADTFNVPRPLKVFYLQAEMNRKLLRKRARVFSFLTPEQRELLRTNLILSERFHMLLNEDGVKVAIDTIQAAFPDEPPDVIAIDPLANMYDGENESDNAQMLRFLQNRVGAIRQKINPLAMIAMVHHSRKAGAEDLARDPFSCIRGAGSLRSYHDSAIMLFKKAAEGRERCCHFELRSGESPEPIEVELADGRFRLFTGDDLPPMDVCRAILLAVDKAWKSGRPWSPNARSKTEGLHAATNIAKQFGIRVNAAQALIDAWRQEGVVTLQDRVPRKRPAGLEVTGIVGGRVE